MSQREHFQHSGLVLKKEEKKGLAIEHLLGAGHGSRYFPGYSLTYAVYWTIHTHTHIHKCGRKVLLLASV